MRFSALLAVPMALVGLAVPASAEDPGLTVTWPTETDVEVWPHTEYRFTVADTATEPQGRLFAEWQGMRQEIPHNAMAYLRFSKGGVGTVKVIRCIDVDAAEPVCTDTGVASPELTVWKPTPTEFTGVDVFYRPGVKTVQVQVPEKPNSELTFNWDFPGSPSTANGTTVVTTDGEGRGQFSFTVPSDPNVGMLRAVAEYDEGPFGLHRAIGYAHFNIDTESPRLSLGLSASGFYPAPDGYRDVLRVHPGSSEWVRFTLDVLNSRGAVVRRLASGTGSEDSDGLRSSWSWGGRDSHGRLVPAGNYTIRFTGIDRVDRKTTTSKKISVSSKRIQKRTWTRTFKASSTVLPNGSLVQACSTLRKPSLRGWAGSLGYYSRAKCNRDNADIVSTTNGIYVPTAFQNRYGTYQVSFYGGGARGTRGAYIVMGYLNNKNAFTHRIQGGAQVRSYAGKVASAGNFVHDKTTRPYVLWTAGLTDGSRYDVKSFTVKLTYTALQ